MSDFGSRLRTLREALGLSQAEFAARCGLPVDSVQNWEQNRVRPRLPALLKLAQGLGVTLDALVAEEPKKRPGRPRSE